MLAEVRLNNLVTFSDEKSSHALRKLGLGGGVGGGLLGGLRGECETRFGEGAVRNITVSVFFCGFFFTMVFEGFFRCNFFFWVVILYIAIYNRYIFCDCDSGRRTEKETA